MDVMFNRYNFLVVIYSCWILRYLITITVISQSKAITWFEAQKECREKNQSLSLWKNESTRLYWTGFYKKRSHWIKIMGCYHAKDIQNDNDKHFTLSISSPPLCQEHCLQQNSSLFAVQEKKCICLADGFENNQNQIAPSDCNYTCREGWLLLSECGGESAFNVFLTDRTYLNDTKNCLSLQCGDPRIVDNPCSLYLPTICALDTPNTWKLSKEFCKEAGGYPIGNLSLSNASLSCAQSAYNGSGPRWIGVVKQLYQKEDLGQLITNTEKMSIKKCLKCRFDGGSQLPECQYVSCNFNLSSTIQCSRGEFTTQHPENANRSNSETTKGSSTLEITTTSIFYTDLEITQSKGSAIIIAPVIIVALLLSVCVVAVILYIRRKKQAKVKEGNGEGKSPTVGSTIYLNAENHIDNNYFVLQKSNPSYEFAGECIVGSESPYNDAEDGTYDHLGNKDARKTPAEDIYNHTSGAELSDLSDYAVTNHKRLNEEDSTYDHAGVGDSSYGKFDLHQIKETNYSVMS